MLCSTGRKIFKKFPKIFIFGAETIIYRFFNNSSSISWNWCNLLILTILTTTIYSFITIFLSNYQSFFHFGGAFTIEFKLIEITITILMLIAGLTFFITILAFFLHFIRKFRDLAVFHSFPVFFTFYRGMSLSFYFETVLFFKCFSFSKTLF